MSDVELPPLPLSTRTIVVYGPGSTGTAVNAYLEAQMRAYGRQCYEAALEAAAKVADAPKIVARFEDDEAAAKQMSDLLEFYMGGVAAAIRAMKTENL